MTNYTAQCGNEDKLTQKQIPSNKTFFLNDFLTFIFIIYNNEHTNKIQTLLFIIIMASNISIQSIT